MLRRGVERHQAGRLEEAAALYDAVLAAAPHHADALYLRAVVYHQIGEDGRAEPLLSQAIALGAPKATHLYQRGLVRERLGRRREARSDLESALSVQPGFGEALAALGRVCLALEDYAAAREALAAAAGALPGDEAVWSNLAAAALALEEYDLAREACRKSLRINPASREARFHQAVLLAARERPREALAAYEELVRDDPSFVAAWINLGNLHLRLGDADAARRVFEAAVAKRPDHADLRFALAVTLHESGKLEDARREYEGALAADPEHSKAAENLASLSRSLGAIDDAIRWGRRAAALNPVSELAAVNLGNAFAELGDLSAAKDWYRRAAALRPDDWLARLRVARVCPAVYESQEEIVAWRREFEGRLDEFADGPRPLDPASLATSGCEPPFFMQFHGLDERPIREKYAQLFTHEFSPADPPRSPGGRPKVGVVVTDGNEPLFVRSMMGVLDRLDPEAFRLVVVCSRRGRAAVARSLSRDDVEFVELPGRFDLAVEAVRAARLDLAYFWEIATDSMNYFLPFARVAPVQCTSWGIQVTSGVPAVEAYVSSRLLEPPEGERHYTERLILTRSLPSYQRRRTRPAGPLDRAEFGLSADANVYACVQNIGKFHPDFDAALAGILARDASGRIVLAESRQPAANGKLRARFERVLGKDAGRIRFLPPMDVETYHRLLCVSDVMLDPFPFGGVNTTYDGLSFGLPVATLPGKFQRGRYAYGCYMQMGLEGLAATSLEDYVERAVRWGRDAEERREVQRRIVDRGEQIFERPECAAELGIAFLALLEGG